MVFQELLWKLSLEQELRNKEVKLKSNLHLTSFAETQIQADTVDGLFLQHSCYEHYFLLIITYNHLIRRGIVTI